METTKGANTKIDRVELGQQLRASHFSLGNASKFIFVI